MKNLNLRVLLVFAVLLMISGCQRDDLCPAATQTTSLLVIRFYDVEELENPQAPTNLSVREINNDTTYFTRQNLDSIAIPLRTDQDQTIYEFILNDPENEDEEQSIPTNADRLEFNYGRETTYLNRACSYKVEFVDLKVSLDEGEDGAWIQDITVEQTNIENENSAHISLYY